MKKSSMILLILALLLAVPAGLPVLIDRNSDAAINFPMILMALAGAAFALGSKKFPALLALGYKLAILAVIGELGLAFLGIEDEALLSALPCMASGLLTIWAIARSQS